MHDRHEPPRPSDPLVSSSLCQRSAFGASKSLPGFINRHIRRYSQHLKPESTRRHPNLPKRRSQSFAPTSLGPGPSVSSTWRPDCRRPRPRCAAACREPHPFAQAAASLPFSARKTGPAGEPAGPVPNGARVLSHRAVSCDSLTEPPFTAHGHGSFPSGRPLRMRAAGAQHLLTTRSWHETNSRSFRYAAASVTTGISFSASS